MAADGIAPENVYDHTWWLPGTGMQRGSTYLGDGDPLTPGWPSTGMNIGNYLCVLSSYLI